MGWAMSIEWMSVSEMGRVTLLDAFLRQVHEHLGFIPTDPVNLVHRYLHFFPGKPMTGLDDHLANRPALGVHHKIADVADHPVARLEVVAVHGLRAPQMRIGTFGLRATRSGWLTRKRFWRQLQNRKAAHAPQPVTLPVVGPAVISVILLALL